MKLWDRNDETFLLEAFDERARAQAIERLTRDRRRTRWVGVGMLLLVLAALFTRSANETTVWIFCLLVWATAAELESRLRLLRVVERLVDERPQPGA